MKCSAWYVKFPLDAYALGPLRFNRPVDEREARAEARRFHHGEQHADRSLPRGTQVWAAWDMVSRREWPRNMED